MISNPKLRSNVTVSSSVRVCPSFSCSLIRCDIISGLTFIQSGTLARCDILLHFQPRRTESIIEPRRIGYGEHGDATQFG
jgi:hypothetical protein